MYLDSSISSKCGSDTQKKVLARLWGDQTPPPKLLLVCLWPLPSIDTEGNALAALHRMIQQPCPLIRALLIHKYRYLLGEHCRIISSGCLLANVEFTSLHIGHSARYVSTEIMFPHHYLCTPKATTPTF